MAYDAAEMIKTNQNPHAEEAIMLLREPFVQASSESLVEMEQRFFELAHEEYLRGDGHDDAVVDALIDLALLSELALVDLDEDDAQISQGLEESYIMHGDVILGLNDPDFQGRAHDRVLDSLMDIEESSDTEGWNTNVDGTYLAEFRDKLEQEKKQIQDMKDKARIMLSYMDTHLDMKRVRELDHN